MNLQKIVQKIAGLFFTEQEKNFRYSHMIGFRAPIGSQTRTHKIFRSLFSFQRAESAVCAAEVRGLIGGRVSIVN